MSLNCTGPLTHGPFFFNKYYSTTDKWLVEFMMQNRGYGGWTMGLKHPRILISLAGPGTNPLTPQPPPPSPLRYQRLVVIRTTNVGKEEKVYLLNYKTQRSNRKTTRTNKSIIRWLIKWKIYSNINSFHISQHYWLDDTLEDLRFQHYGRIGVLQRII